MRNKREPRSREEGFLETAVGVFIQPVVTMRSVTRRRPVDWAIVLIVVLATASTAMGAARDFGGDFGSSPWEVALLLGGAALYLVLWLGAIVAASGAIHLMSRLLGGSGSFAGLFAGNAFASLPQVLTIPAVFLRLAPGTTGDRIAVLVQLLVLVWWMALAVIVARENYGFTTPRAAASVLISLSVLLAVLIVVLIPLAVIVYVFLLAMGYNL